MSIKIDEEFQNLIPPLSKEEFKQLEENILAEGIRDPLVVWHVPNGDDIMIDGHNRWSISAHHGGIKFEIVRKQFQNRTEAIEWIIKNQLGRRNIPAYVRAELALKLKPVIEAQAKKRMSEGAKGAQISAEAKGETRDKLAQAAGVSHDTIHKVEKIQEKASADEKAALRRGEVSINQVYSGIVAAENESRRQQEAREIKEAKKRNEEFEEQKADGVVNLADAKQNKEDEKLIFDDFSSGFVNMVQTVRSYGAMVGIGSFEKAVRMADKYELRQMSERLLDCYRAILKMQRIVAEVIDEE